MRQEVPYCSSCGNGVMKPDITFFGEKLPTAVKRAVEVDRKKARGGLLSTACRKEFLWVVVSKDT